MEVCQRREEWSEDDRLSAVKAGLSEVNEGTDQDATVGKITFFFFFGHYFLVNFLFK
jgi:hypothetical protein